LSNKQDVANLLSYTPAGDDRICSEVKKKYWTWYKCI